MAPVWDADLVLKVKEPLASEYQYLQGQILFTYLHLAGVSKALTEALLRQQTTAVAYETVEDAQGRLPLLAPMSAIAGNMASTIGSYYLAAFNHGKGVQLGTVLGTRYGTVVIVGDGVVGQHVPGPRTAWAHRCFSVAAIIGEKPSSSGILRLTWAFSRPPRTICPGTWQMRISSWVQCSYAQQKHRTWSPRIWSSVCKLAR